MYEDFLFLIPARGGSKGIPKKNIKELNGKPLIYYTLDAIKDIAPKENICVSTDDKEIIEKVEAYGINVPFERPFEFATDKASTSDVILNALNYYEEIGKEFCAIVLLQPTSPLRRPHQIIEAIKMYTPEIDMVVSVKKSHAVAVICNENQDGYLELTFSKNGVRRQDMTDYYEYNGAIYVINTSSFRQFSLSGLRKIMKYIMPEIDSVDIDTFVDWKLCESILRIDK